MPPNLQNDICEQTRLSRRAQQATAPKNKKAPVLVNKEVP